MSSKFVIGLAIALLAACTTPFGTPVFASKSDVTDFLGVASQLSPFRPTDVLLVHGMCTHNADWAKKAVSGLVGPLGGAPDGVKLEPVKVAGTSIVLHQQTFQLPGGSLRANAIEWSPITTPLKRDLCYDQSKKSASCSPEEKAKVYPYARASLNKTLKDGLLNDCLADAIIYQGRARDEINAQMQEAILQAIATSGGQPAIASTARVAANVPVGLPLVVITESLGSKVAFDAIEKLTKSPSISRAEAGRQTFKRMTQIFMQANQLPILALADRRLDGTATLSRDVNAYPEDPISSLLRSSEPSLLSGESRSSSLQVVAFTDPNDVLSYILVSSPHAAKQAYLPIDVVISNSTTYLGLLEVPTTAHTGYMENPKVAKLIACGKSKNLASC